MAKKRKKPIPRNSRQYEQLASEYLIKATPILDETATQAHNLYNCALYDIRQAFFKHQYINSFTDLNAMFKKRYELKENMLYHKLGYVQSAQQTLKEVMTVWQAWLRALKTYRKNPTKFTGRPRMPKYLHRDQRHTFYVTSQNARVNKAGFLVIPKLSITDNGKYLGIDPGIDNAFACVTNTGDRPLLINGHAIKSVNQYYNKKRAELKQLQAKYHQLEKMINTKQGLKPIYQETKAMKRITAWRNDKIRQFAHKASKCIVDYALSCGTNTIVIGRNKSWKCSSDMGKRNNHNFIGIPHKTMIDMIKYKANLAGITVIQTNESYTSQTSALDHEQPCWNNANKSRKKQGKSPINRRIKRGLFKANDGTLINADVNGALQIIKKVFPNFSLDDGIVGAVLRPIKWSPAI